MQTLNYNSLLILGLAILAAAAFMLLRRGFEQKKILILAGILAAMIVGWLIIRPRATPAANPMELYNQIGAGTPVLLEFQSPY